MTNSSETRARRETVFTEALAKKIARKVEVMPDQGLAVTWDNVIDLVKTSFGVDCRRNVLSQKEWNGRKIIAEAFRDAKTYERGVRHQAMPKYASASSAVLRARMERLENECVDLTLQLEKARTVKRGKIDLYRLTRNDLPASEPANGSAEHQGHGQAASAAASRLGGRKELLNRDLAEKIAKMIQRMPEARIPITWDNVVSKIKSDFGPEFRRNILSRKEWDGRKIIAEGFSAAKALEAEMSKTATLERKTGARAVLRTSLGMLEAKANALKEELATVRLSQLGQFENYQASRPDLRQLVAALDRGKPG